MRKVSSVSLASWAAGVLLIGCATIPTGPSVLVLPGQGKTLDRFQHDDAVCRQWSSQQIGTTRQQAVTESTVTGAVVGTTLGAATGAAIGAAAGSPGTGAAVGSAVGLLGGTAAGAQQGEYSGWELQRRYDVAYMQCMYTKGHQIPVPRGYQRPRTSWNQGSSEPHQAAIPPPPAGNPPAPPDDH
jgi:Glycine-zipper domain